MMAVTACCSVSLSPRPPATRRPPSSPASACSASAKVKGGWSMAVSLRISIRTPPSPRTTMGPNTGSSMDARR